MSKAKLTAALLVAALTAAAADPDKLKKVAEDAIDLAKEQEAALDTAATLNAELQDKLDAMAQGKKVKPSFKTKTAEYEVNHSVNLDGVVYTPNEIAENAAVQKLLIAGDSDAITKKEKSTE